MTKLIRSSLLFGAPMLVGILNLFHPVHFEATGIYDAVQSRVAWWLALHLLNLLGFALLGLAAWLLIAEQRGLAATIGKIALALFVPVYAGFDALAGVGTGLLIQYARSLSPDQLTIVKPAIDAYWSSSVLNVLAAVGSVAWGIGVIASAVAFTEQRRRPAVVALGLAALALTGWGASAHTSGTLPWWIVAGVVALAVLVVGRPSVPAALLLLAGVFFGTTHVVPYGPLGIACFVAAAAWLEYGPQRVKSARPLATPA